MLLANDFVELFRAPAPRDHLVSFFGHFGRENLIGAAGTFNLESEILTECPGVGCVATMLKRILRLAGLFGVIALLLVGLGVATLDLTVRWLIRPALHHMGATVDAIESADGHYALSGLRWTDPGAGLSADADRVLLPMPWRLINRKLFGRPLEATVEADGIVVVQSEGTRDEGQVNPEGEAPLDLGELTKTVLDGWKTGLQWLDTIALNTIVFREGNDDRMRVKRLSIDERDLVATDVFSPEFDGALSAVISRQGSGDLGIQLTVPAHDLTVQMQVDASENLALEGEAFLGEASNRATFTATWGFGGVVPSFATVKTSSFRVPEDLLEIPGYEPPSIDLDATWDGEAAAVSLAASAQPSEGRYPTLDVRLVANGDRETVTVEKLVALAWSSELRLAAPLTVDFDDWESIPDAELIADIDLDAVPLDAIGGRLQGSVRAEHRSGLLPQVTVAFVGQDLSYRSVELETFQLQAEADYPIVTVKRLEGATRDGSTISVVAEADAEREEIVAARIESDWEGGLLSTLEPLMGEAPVTFQTAALRVEASGPWLEPRHAGTFTVTGLKPEKMIADDLAVEWQGDYLDFSSITIDLTSDRGEAELAASASLAGADKTVTLNHFRLAIANEPELTAREPATIDLQKTGGIRVDGLKIDSTAGGGLQLNATIDYPARGALELQARDISGDWLDLLMEEPLPFAVEIDQFLVDARWEEGPVTADVAVDIQASPPDQSPVTIHLKGVADGETILLDGAEVVQGTIRLLNASGELPLAVVPASEPVLVFDPAAAANFSLRAAPDDSGIWNMLEEQLGFDFVRPVIALDIEGSVTEPAGELRVDFDSFEALEVEDKKQLPRVENAVIRARFSEARAELNELTVMIAGQPLHAEGAVPMGREAWEALVENGTVPDWQTASGKLDFADVPLAAFADWLPDMLRDDGDVSLFAELPPGERLRGRLEISDVRTRPIASVGAVNDINADFVLDDRVLRVEKAAAVLGGAAVNLGGEVRVSDDFKPVFNLSVTGNTVPVVRSPGIILRASPDIRVVTDADGITTIRGSVELNESFFTMDLTDFGPGGGGGGGVEGDGATAKPPFFSITEEPLADWRLHLRISGDRFLRIAVPAFEGVGSANFNLRGALRDPFMFGQATLETGVVLFPFANLRMQQGVVSISQNDPATVKLDVLATGRAYGYDIDMRVGGTSTAPEITFTSTPTLEQSDILLMITSGQVPNQARSTTSKLSGIGMYIGNSFLADLGLIDPLDETLTVNVGEDVTVSGKDTIDVRYRISEDWTAVGAYDKFDAYYLDMEWTVYRD